MLSLSFNFVKDEIRWELAGDHVATAAQPVQATLQIEVVQACGLLAAVNAAGEWTEGIQSKYC